MTNKHTPAPWDARWMMHNNRVSQYLVTHDNLYEQAEANAKLIAAAPDLLALLIDLVEKEHYQLNAFTINRIQSAIKKATA